MPRELPRQMPWELPRDCKLRLLCPLEKSLTIWAQQPQFHRDSVCDPKLAAGMAS